MTLHKLAKEKIVFIESNTTGTGELFLKCAIQKGYQVLFLTSSEALYPFLEKLLIYPILINTKDIKEIENRLSHEKNIIGVLSTSDFFVEIAANIALILGLHSVSINSIRNCRNKKTLSEFLINNNIAAPITLSAASIEQAKLLDLKLNYPVIVKPNFGSGSRGVRLCQDKKAYVDYIKTYQFTEDELLIQPYISGDEYSVEAIGLNDKIEIIGITKKYLGNLPYFVEIGHDFPAQLTQSTTNTIVQTVKKALKAVGLTFGPSHTEIRINNDIPYVIEINPRLAGGMIPCMIEAATGWNLISTIIDLYVTKNITIPLLNKDYASIRFIMPKMEGYLASVNISFNLNDPRIYKFNLSKKVGDFIVLSGDFKDRIGFVITCDSDFTTCNSLAQEAVHSISLDIAQEKPANSNENERLDSVLRNDALFIINKYKSFSPHDEIVQLHDINEAHLIMLVKKKIISPKTAGKILGEMKHIKENNFENILEKKNPRGIYLGYENYLIKKLGLNVGGMLHIGRSRNDINATTFHLILRKYYWTVYNAIWRLRYTLILRAQESVSLVFPIYSQYQTALPGTFAHYLLGVGEALFRDQDSLKYIYKFLMQCPLGACAGAGTSFNIEPEITSKLLGFDTNYVNSLDAVASRDLVLRFLACLCGISMNVSRIAEDIQLWTTNEYCIAELPDNLCGGSSMMPQKRNPYILEKIKGISAGLIGCFVSALTVMFKVPFGNSIEINSESIKDIDYAAELIVDSADLLSIVLQEIKLIPQNIEKTINENLTYSFIIAEDMVRNNSYSFRDAHHVIAKAIRESKLANISPSDTLLNTLNASTLSEVNPICWTRLLEYGYGPGENSIKNALVQASSQLNKDGQWLQKRESAIDKKVKLRKKIANKLISR